ncbi:hypothetical protein BGZ75_004221 [Mortierella antarctica]|nr:hypothetical protein BGZ75_004221 [Mortierella antarctica]
MSGRLDPVSDELGSDDWAFHLMMAIYFFFTVIVMLNVLIALVNVAFMKSDATLRVIKCRLYYIEKAENLSYHIPHFRQTYDWFPKEIYFYATAQEVEEYEEALRASEGEGKDSLKNDPAIRDLKAQVQHLESQLASQQGQVEQQLTELKELLLGCVGNRKTD